MVAQTLSPQAKNRLFLIFIIALFAVPLALAWLLVGHWQPSGSRHHGELLNPARPFTEFVATRTDGEVLDSRYLHGRWTLLYPAGSDCAQDCRTSLYDMRQVRLALGKDIDRLQMLFLLPTAPDAQLSDWLAQEHAQTTVAVAAATTTAFLTQAFAGATLGDGIYLLDPLGNLVLHYRAVENPKHILDDIKHLLKLSNIG